MHPPNSGEGLRPRDSTIGRCLKRDARRHLFEPQGISRLGTALTSKVSTPSPPARAPCVTGRWWHTGIAFEVGTHALGGTGTIEHCPGRLGRDPWLSRRETCWAKVVCSLVTSRVVKLLEWSKGSWSHYRRHHPVARGMRVRV